MSTPAEGPSGRDVQSQSWVSMNSDIFRCSSTRRGYNHPPLLHSLLGRQPSPRDVLVCPVPRLKDCGPSSLMREPTLALS